MSQHDFTIANQTASSARSDINDALQALVSNNSGADAPTTPYEKMWWYDTSNNILKSYKGSGTWINVGRFNQTTNKFEILDYTKVVSATGYEVGTLGAQAESVWALGTGDTESLVSPSKVKSAIESLVPDTLGENQSYASTTLTTGTWYQNTTGRAIAIYYRLNVGGGSALVSTTASGGVTVGGPDGDSGTWDNGYFIVPNTHYYKTDGSSYRAAAMLS